MERGAPNLAGLDRHGAGERSRGVDLAGGERRIDRIIRQEPDQMPERGERAVEHIGGMAAIDVPAVAEKVDVEARERREPFAGARRDRVTSACTVVS